MHLGMFYDVGLTKGFIIIAVVNLYVSIMEGT